MSTQDASGIPFSASHQQHAFKLLELPPELLQLLESHNPPTYCIPLLRLLEAPNMPCRLYLKSSTASHAILCSPEKTYHIQQKNSSNPIMILQSCTSAIVDSDVPTSAIPCAAVRTISTIDSTLELCKMESEAANTAPGKPNKWHEKFAKGRPSGMGKGRD